VRVLLPSPQAKKAGGAQNAAAEATNLLAPSKNISELDCFITHGRTLTCQFTQLYFIRPSEARPLGPKGE